MNNKNCSYTFHDKSTNFNLNIDIYPQEELELIIYDFCIVSKVFSTEELKEIEQLSEESFMLNFNIN